MSYTPISGLLFDDSAPIIRLRLVLSPAGLVEGRRVELLTPPCRGGVFPLKLTPPVFNRMTRWTQDFKIVQIVVCPIMVYMMDLQDFGDRVITTSVA